MYVCMYVCVHAYMCMCVCVCMLCLCFNYMHAHTQTILSGMGELHLEIIQERIRREFGIDVMFGHLRVAYREVPTQRVTQEGMDVIITNFCIFYTHTCNTALCLVS